MRMPAASGSVNSAAGDCGPGDVGDRAEHVVAVGGDQDLGADRPAGDVAQLGVVAGLDGGGLDVRVGGDGELAHLVVVVGAKGPDLHDPRTLPPPPRHRVAPVGRRPLPSPAMEFALSPELLALRDEAFKVGLAASERAEVPEDTWITGHDRAFAEELGTRGWLGMTWPVEHGGGGRPVLERFVVFEALISVGAPIAAAWFADRQMGPTLLQFGTDEQRARWLPGIIEGTSMWCIGMSEPDAGSNVAGIRTRAERDGDEWVVNGQKIWTSGAFDADWCYLIARTDPDAKPHEGLSELIVDMRSPGVSVVPILDMTDSRHFCEVFFEDVRVPAANLVGELNGSFRQVMRQMEHERGGIDRLVSNRRLYEDVRPLADTADPLVRQEIAAIESGYRIGRHARAARDPRPGPPRVLGRHQDVLHRARAAHRRVLRARAGAPGDARRARASPTG